jgi:hypothetical protein
MHRFTLSGTLAPLLAALAAFGTAFAAPRPAEAQMSGAAELVLAALPAVRETLPSGPAALDPQLLCTARLAGWSCPPEVSGAAADLGLMLHSRNFAYICPGDRRSCRLVSVRSLVHFTEPVVQGDTATLLLDVWWQTENRAQPVAHRRARLTFHRDAQGWKLGHTEPLVAGGL